MFYGMFCGRRKREPERLLNILLRACECARVGSMQKVRTKAGKQEVFHKRERQKREKVPVWLEKTWQAASVKCERFQMKIGMTGKKHGWSLHKTGRKKRFGNPKMSE